MTVSHPVGQPWPQPRQRPELASSIAIATELWLVVIAALALAQVGGYGPVRDAMVQRQADLPKDASESTRQSAELMTNPGLIIASLVGSVLVGAAITLTVMYFVRSGHTWARLVLSGLSVYVLVGALLAFAGDRTWTQAPQIIAAGCAGGALIALMRRDADTYCREMAEFRAAAKTPVAPAPGAWPPVPGQYPPVGPYPPPGPPPAGPQPPEGSGGTRG